jgi:hypothetical protein
MTRSLTLALLALSLAAPIFAQGPCNLEISLTCTSGDCTSATKNAGTNTCAGDYIIGYIATVPADQVTFTSFTNTLGLVDCFTSTDFPSFGEAFALCEGTTSLAAGSTFTTTVHYQASASAPSPLPLLAVTLVDDSDTGDQIGLAYIFNTGQILSCTPVANVPSGTQSNVPYTVSWTPVSDSSVSTFIVDESTKSDFSANFTTRMVMGLSTQFQHAVSTATAYYYRVHAPTCSGSPGPNSDVVSIVIQTPTVTARAADAVVPVGSTTPVTITVSIPSPTGKQAFDVPFTASVDKPYLTVSPSSGTIPPGGTTVTVTANPTDLPPGANTGTLNVTSNGANVATKSVSVSLVTPVSPGGKGLPPSNALVIPVVTHAPGINGPFQSDVRLTNATGAQVTYDVSFTPSRTNGTQSGKKTSITVDADQTIALNDIVRDFFGLGVTDAPGDNGFGSLEIRPTNTSSTQTFASSRTFTFNAKGSFGQFIAAVPFSEFATNASLIPFPGGGPPQTASLLSLQQVAQSSKFRTNLGLVEGSGQAASGRINFYDDAGSLLKSVPYSLQPGEHQQKSLSADYQVTNLSDGRIEVTVDSPTGAVTAYASVVDNITSDPLAVMPVQTSQISATRYVVPGMAEFTSAFSNFHSDLRLFNGGSAPVTVTATYYPQTGGSQSAAPFPVGKGEVKAFDNVLPMLFGATGGGSVVFTTTSPSSLVATGRTYSNSTDQPGGTFGQFIPGVSPAQGIGLGDRPLQILQLEESANFRSNVGLAELTGNPVDLKISAIVPGSKVATSVPQHLNGNQFLQLGQILKSFGLGSSVYNARIIVEVTGGSGRATAYASVIDNATTDPTYVPAK